MALPPALRVTVEVTLDGQPIPGFPMLRRTIESKAQLLRSLRTGDGPATNIFVELVADTQAAIAFLALTVIGGPSALALNGVTPDPTTAITLDPDGLALAFETRLDDPNERVALAHPTSAVVVRTALLGSVDT